MTPSSSSAPPLQFGPYRLDLDAARLTRDGEPVALRPKAFDLLVALAARPDVLVTKDELLDRVWGRRFISEGVIKSIVGELRVALDDDPKRPRWIETVPRRGYRFIGGSKPAAIVDFESPPPVSAVVEGNLPLSLPAPIGRDGALQAVGALLGSHRLLTIVGPAGVGKTRLALALAASLRGGCRDGVWLVELAALAADTNDAVALRSLLAQLLRLDAAAGRDVAAIGRALRPLQMVLVLDNAEHLLEPVAALVRALLADAPWLRIVVTSQEPLRIGDERVYRLAPLTLPEADDADGVRLMESSAVRLFVERVAARLPGFVLAPRQQQAVAAICRALDGMPLAIELAAARVPLLGVHGIADLLIGTKDTRLRWLTQGARDAAPRQRTLRNAIEWSYRLLDETQQRVFRRLGVFEGGFTLEAARIVSTDGDVDAWRVVDALGALVDKSLLESLDTGDAPRFRLLESLRTYALEELVAAGEGDGARDRHLQAAVVHWTAADLASLVDPGLPWIARHLVEIDNLRAALRRAVAHCDPDALVALVAHSSMLWARAGLGVEARRWVQAARSRRSTAAPMLQARFDLAVAALALYVSAWPAAEVRDGLVDAIDAFETSDDAPRAYYGLYLLFQLHLRAQVAFDRDALLARMRALEDPRWSLQLRRFLRAARSYELRVAGHPEAYLASCRTELALCRDAGAVAEGWVAAQGLMLAEHDVGHADLALAVGGEALDGIRRAGRLRQYPVFLALWTTMLAESGDVDAARRALSETLPILDGNGNAWMAHVAMAWCASRAGRDAAAAQVLGRHAAALADGSAVAPGAYVARATRSLEARLTAALGAAAFARHHDAGRGMGEDEILRAAFEP